MSAIETLAKAVANQDKDDSLAAARNKARMKLEPFATRYEPSSSKTKDQLRGWKPPGGVSGEDAYVIFEKKMIERGDRAPDTIVYTLHVLLVGSRPEQKEKIRYNVEQKGMKIIHWDRFPKVNDSNPFRARLAAMHYNPQTRVSAYDELERILIHLAEGKSEDGQNQSDLRAQLADKDAVIADLTDKLKAKRNQSNGGEGQ